jgi:hypothetical protein
MPWPALDKFNSLKRDLFLPRPPTVQPMASTFKRVRSGVTSSLTAAIAVLATTTASAHPGHGVTPDGDSAAHYLLEPVHGLGLVVAALVAITSVAIVRSRKGRATAE